MELVDFITRSNAAPNSVALFGMYGAAMAARGYDRLVFSLLTDHAAIGRPAGHAVMCTYPEAWMRHYMAKRYADIDPVRHQIPHAEGVFTWDSLHQRQQLTKEQDLCLHQAAKAGLRDGIGIPLRGPRGV